MIVGKGDIKLMRKILVILCLLMSFSVYSTAEEEYFKKVYEVDMSKNDIYYNILQWMAENFNSSKAVIEYKDREQGKIIGKTILMYNQNPFPFLEATPCETTITIDIKDKKYRIKCSNYAGVFKGKRFPLNYAYQFENMNKKILEMTDKLHLSLSDKNSREDDF